MNSSYSFLMISFTSFFKSSKLLYKRYNGLVDIPASAAKDLALILSLTYYSTIFNSTLNRVSLSIILLPAIKSLPKIKW